MAIGIAREEEASRIRKELAEAKRKALEAKKQEHTDVLKQSSDAFDGVESKVAAVEEKAKPLAEDFGSPDEVTTCAEAVQRELEAAESDLAAQREAAAALGTDVQEELQDFVQFEVRTLELRASKLKMRLDKVSAHVQRGKSHVVALKRAARERVCGEVKKAFRAHVVKEKLTPEAFFTAVDKDGDGAASEEEFNAFVCTLEGGESIAGELNLLHADGKKTLSKEEVLRMAKVYYCVQLDTVMTADMSVKATTTVRRVESLEVIEWLEGPVNDEETGLTRIRGAATKDGAQGWITVTSSTSSNGSPFLVEGGDVWKVSRETALSEEADGSVPVRALSVGEVLEVIEWGAASASVSSTLPRVKVQARSDSAVGWVSRSGQDSTPFLELVST